MRREACSGEQAKAEEEEEEEGGMAAEAEATVAATCALGKIGG